MSRARILADYVSSGDELALKAPLASPAFTGTPTGITAAHITSGVLPVGVTGGTGLTAIAGVTTGSGNVTITDGNLILDSGNGIDFSDTADGGVSTPNELLDDYEEGTWTPAIVGGTMTFTLQSATYTKIGRSVTIQCHWGGNNNGDSTGLVVSGLPFTAGAGEQYAVGSINYATGNVDVGDSTPRVGPSNTTIYFSTNPQLALQQTHVDLNHFIFSVTYFSA